MVRVCMRSEGSEGVRRCDSVEGGHTIYTCVCISITLDWEVFAIQIFLY